MAQWIHKMIEPSFSPPVYICRYCDKSLLNEQQLNSHEKEEHLDIAGTASTHQEVHGDSANSGNDVNPASAPGESQTLRDDDGSTHATGESGDKEYEKKSDICRLLAGNSSQPRKVRRHSNSSACTIPCDDDFLTPESLDEDLIDLLPTGDGERSVSHITCNIIKTLDEIRETMLKIVDHCQQPENPVDQIDLVSDEERIDENEVDFDESVTDSIHNVPCMRVTPSLNNLNTEHVTANNSHEDLSLPVNVNPESSTENVHLNSIPAIVSQAEENNCCPETESLIEINNAGPSASGIVEVGDLRAYEDAGLLTDDEDFIDEQEIVSADQINPLVTSMIGEHFQQKSSTNSQDSIIYANLPAEVKNIPTDADLPWRIESVVSCAHANQQEPLVERREENNHDDSEDSDIIMMSEDICTNINNGNYNSGSIEGPSLPDIISVPDVSVSKIDLQPELYLPCITCSQNFTSEEALTLHSETCFFKNVDTDHVSTAVVTSISPNATVIHHSQPPFRAEATDGPVEVNIHLPTGTSVTVTAPQSTTNKLTVFKCGKCGALRESRAGLEEHFKTHFVLKCDECPKNVKTLQGLKLHKAAHERKRQAKKNKSRVNNCIPATAPSPGNSRMEVGLPLTEERSSASASTVTGGNAVFKCELCPSEFNDRTSYMFHLKTFHRMDISVIIPSAHNSDDQMYGKEINETTNHNTHKNAFTCDICTSVSFDEESHLNDHLKTIHGFTVLD